MIDWHFNADFHGREAETLFGTLPATFAVRGSRSPGTRCRRSSGWRPTVRATTSSATSATARTPCAAGSACRGLLAPQRVVKEWENPAALPAVGYSDGNAGLLGPGRVRGSFVRGAVVTEEIERTMDMGTMANQDDPRLRDRRWMAEVLRQVASHARRMHDEGFAHNDLKWRNLLVDDGDVPTVT